MARRKAATRKKRSPGAPALRSFSVRLDVAAVEMAAGHDGLLRGMPEPALLLGLYRVGGGPAVLVGRGQIVLQPTGAFPLVVEPPSADRELVRTRISLGTDQCLAILVVALEVDGGRDLARIYAGLQDLAAIRLWEGETVLPSPVPIDEMALRAPTSPALVVQAILGEEDLGRTCRDDELVGVCLATRPRRALTEHVRFPFKSADGRNDWTAVVHVAVR